MRRADSAGAVLALVGVVNVPIIYFSVQWWNTLHQGASISVTAAPKMAQTMLMAMLLMTLAFWVYAFAVVFTRAQAMVLERERHADGCATAARGRPQCAAVRSCNDVGQPCGVSSPWAVTALYVWGAYAVCLAAMLAERWLRPTSARR